MNRKILDLLKWLIGIWLAGSVLISCSGLQTANNYLLNNNEGLVFFTMTESGYISKHYQLVFMNKSTKAEYTVSLKPDAIHDIGNKQAAKDNYLQYDNPLGKLVVLRLPAGVYNLKKWAVKENTRPGKYSLKKTPNKAFRVMNGRSLYIGNVHLLNSKTHSSVIIKDNRIRDLKLFYKRYPRVEQNKLLVSSHAFLNPGADRNRVFEAYTACSLNDYELFSKKRLPTGIEGFRTLRMGAEEIKISRIDGYRLKYDSTKGNASLKMKIELSEARHYLSDKSNIKKWFDGLGKKAVSYDVTYEEKDFFSEFQLKTHQVGEKRMVYMVTMMDDVSQIITNMTFVNPPEFRRLYKTAEEFIPAGVSTVNAYQQCVVERLNKIL